MTTIARALAPLLLVTLGGCSLSDAIHHRQEGEVVGQRLLTAGFHAIPADTPEKKAHLETMPKLLFSSVVRDGQRRYLLADPYSCHCLYVGDEAAYDRYTEIEIGRELSASERAEARQEAAVVAVDREQRFLGPYDGDVVFPTGAAR
jgi:hypothetical protein